MKRIGFTTLFFAAIISCLLSLPFEFLMAEEPMAPRGSILKSEGPYLCHGATENRNNPWRTPSPALHAIECPKGYAFYSARRHSSTAFRGTCCKLPVSDILTSETVERVGQCPPGYVVTGGRPERDLQCIGKRAKCTSNCREKFETCSTRVQELPFLLKCTRVNSERYQLAPDTGVATIRLTSHFRERNVPLTPRRELPLALRYGVGRANRYQWDYNACVGMPWGSLLAGTPQSGKRCESFTFLTLQYRGLPGDPPKGSAVEMYPKCRKISDLYEVGASCQ